MAGGKIWKSIAETLQTEITAGHYRPGARLPSEADLALRFGVNRHTVRHALASLAEDGLVRSRRGAGVFVTSRPTDYPLARRVRFHRNILDGGGSPSKRLTRSETRPADRREAEALALAEGDPVHVIEGISLVDGVPMALFRTVFDARRFPDFPDRYAELLSVSAALAACGLPDFTRASTRLTAKQARPEQALALELPAGAPLLRSVSVNIDAEGRPVEFGRTWFAGDRVTLIVAPEG